MDRRVYALADQLLLIERELRALGWWSESSPAPEALASPEPFCVDTLALEQWLQWIFLPRMKLILESDSALPQARVSWPWPRWPMRSVARKSPACWRRLASSTG